MGDSEDAHGRTLAYVYLDTDRDGKYEHLFNEDLITLGLTRTTTFSHANRCEFERLREEAEERGAGLWDACSEVAVKRVPHPRLSTLPGRRTPNPRRRPAHPPRRRLEAALRVASRPPGAPRAALSRMRRPGRDSPAAGCRPLRKLCGPRTTPLRRA